MKSKQHQLASADEHADAKLAGRPESVKPYETPELICYGDVRDVTLGPTVGVGESGCEVLAPGPATLPCPF